MLQISQCASVPFFSLQNELCWLTPWNSLILYLFVTGQKLQRDALMFTLNIFQFGRCRGSSVRQAIGHVIKPRKLRNVSLLCQKRTIISWKWLDKISHRVLFACLHLPSAGRAEIVRGPKGHCQAVVCFAAVVEKQICSSHCLHPCVRLVFQETTALRATLPALTPQRQLSSQGQIVSFNEGISYTLILLFPLFFSIFPLLFFYLIKVTTVHSALIQSLLLWSKMFL